MRLHALTNCRATLQIAFTARTMFNAVVTSPDLAWSGESQKDGGCRLLKEEKSKLQELPKVFFYGVARMRVMDSISQPLGQWGGGPPKVVPVPPPLGHFLI